MVHFTYVLMAVTLAIALFVAIALDLTDELQHQATTDSLSGRHISKVSGKTAICGRLGGEEFAVLLPDHNEAAAQAIAEAIRSGFDAYGPAITPAPTVSIGVAVSQSPATLSNLLSIADTALYKAKDSGRNQVCVLPAISLNAAQ